MNYRLSDSSISSGIIGTAKALLKKALYLAPNYISVYLELSDIYPKENNPAGASKMRDSALKLLQQ